MAITLSENLKTRLTVALADPTASTELQAAVDNQAANVAALAGTLTGTVTGTIVNVAAAACAVD